MLRIWIFFCLWRRPYYDEIIDADLAWTLAGIFAEHDAEYRSGRS